MSIYQSIYDLINTYIFGGLIETGTYTELVTILLSTTACIFVFAIPFIIVWKVITFVTGG